MLDGSEQLGGSLWHIPFARELIEPLLGAGVSDPNLVSATLPQECLCVEIADQTAA
jgi:hypothetical protein